MKRLGGGGRDPEVRLRVRRRKRFWRGVLSELKR
jgi:hypothetical protein